MCKGKQPVALPTVCNEHARNSADGFVEAEKKRRRRTLRRLCMC